MGMETVRNIKQIVDRGLQGDGRGGAQGIISSHSCSQRTR
jgi:hypothetical protein